MSFIAVWQKTRFGGSLVSEYVGFGIGRANRMPGIDLLSTAD